MQDASIMHTLHSLVLGEVSSVLL